MADSTNQRSYLDINGLIARTGLSRATLWRLKRDDIIPYFQPAGKGGRVTFPEDAIERATASAEVGEKPEAEDRLPGRKPSWQHQAP